MLTVTLTDRQNGTPKQYDPGHLKRLASINVLRHSNNLPFVYLFVYFMFIKGSPDMPHADTVKHQLATKCSIHCRNRMVPDSTGVLQVLL